MYFINQKHIFTKSCNNFDYNRNAPEQGVVTVISEFGLASFGYMEVCLGFDVGWGFIQKN